MNSFNLKIFLAFALASFFGLSAIAQHSLELKKSVVFQQEPIDYYLQVDSAYFNTPHYVLWVDPVENTIIDFNIHIPFAPVSKGSFYIEEDWKAFGEFMLIALPKNNQNNIAFAHLDVVPNNAELLNEWKKLSATNYESWQKVNRSKGDITFQFGPKLSQPPAIESAKLRAKLIEDNWEITIQKPESARNFTLQFSRKDSIVFEADGNSEQQSVSVPVRRLPPGKLNITLMSDGEEIDLLTIRNPLFTLSEAEINIRQLNDSVAQFGLTQLINPWMKLNDLSLKVSITDFPELLMNEAFTGEVSYELDGFEEKTIAVFYAHKKEKEAANEKLVVFNTESELYFTSNQDGKYFFDQSNFALLDDDYHIVSHDNFEDKISVDVVFPDIEIIRKQLPEILTQIPARLSIQRSEKPYGFSLESMEMLLDEVSITAKRKSNTQIDAKQKPNSVHFRNTDYVCLFGVLNCLIHGPTYGYNGEGISYFKVNGQVVKQIGDTGKSKPLHLYLDSNGNTFFRYLPYHSINVKRSYKYPNTFFQEMAAKAKIRNIQEHYFKEEATIGFYSEMVSQAFAPISMLYISEIALPKVYSNAYFMVELIHQPTGMRQRVVKKILPTASE